MRIMTWNIRWGCGCDGRVDFDRIAGVIRRWGPPDVICLQEVAINHPGLAGSDGEDQVAELAARLPGYSAHFGIGSDLPDESGGRRLFGNLVLSRLPVQQVYRHSLPYPADPEHGHMPRVAVEAVVEAPLGPLRIVTTHLEYYSPAQRLAQIQALRTLHAEASGHAEHPGKAGRRVDPPFRAPPRPRPAIFCGDFNCRPGSPEHAALLAPATTPAAGLADAWETAFPGRPHAHTVGLHGCDWPDEPYCCDFFFVSTDLAERILTVDVDRETEASDHQPVCLSLG